MHIWKQMFALIFLEKNSIFDIIHIGKIILTNVILKHDVQFYWYLKVIDMLKCRSYATF